MFALVTQLKQQVCGDAKARWGVPLHDIWHTWSWARGARLLSWC